MRRTEGRPSPAAAVSAAVAGITDGNELLESLAQVVRERIPFDGSGLFATDPATVLPTAPIRAENVERRFCAVHWDREIRVRDALQYRDLARSPVPVGTLLTATRNQPTLSPRYREFLEPQQYGDEIRAALRAGDQTWGVLEVYREKGRKPFSSSDVSSLAGLGPFLAQALRSAAVGGMSAAGAGDAGAATDTGTALFERDARLISYDDRAAAWFTLLAGPQWMDWPVSMSAVCGVLFHAVGVDDGRAWGRSCVRLRTEAGWVTVSASVLREVGGGPGAVAVTVARSRGSDITPLLTEAFGLTPREEEVARAVARGLSNQEIALGLHVSPHTVRDHLKAVFVKVGVHSRTELGAALYADVYAPRIFAPGAPVRHLEF